MFLRRKVEPGRSSGAAAEPRAGESPDGTLARAARAGDADAFRQLYERYAPSVLGFLSSRLRDHASAEDALQEAFCKAYRALESFDLTRPFGPWIATIAEHVAYDHLRKRARAPVRPLPDESSETVPATNPTQAQSAQTAERETILRQALALMAFNPRAVLLLRYQKGLTQKQVADELGCSLRTAQTREALALETLATFLQRAARPGPSAPGEPKDGAP